MSNSNNIMDECIWADGCPAEVKEEYKLTIPQLLVMSVDFLVKQFLIKNGFKIEGVKADIGYLPNIIVRKNGKLYGIAVVPYVYPKIGLLRDEARLNMIKTVKQYNAIPLMAPVGFRSKDSERAKAGLTLKEDVYDVFFDGFIALTEEEHQDFSKSVYTRLED